MMKKLSLKWRITLLSVFLIAITSSSMMLLLSSSGIRYMDVIAQSLQDYTIHGEPSFFDPDNISPDQDFTIIIDGAQKGFKATNWIIMIVVTFLGGVVAYFVTGYALKPLRIFSSQAECVQMNNLGEVKLNEDVIPEFRELSKSINDMLERLNNGFIAQRQFTGNAAHELRTPLALMQAQVELFVAEHPDVKPETAEFLSLLSEQIERLTAMTKTLLEMSNLQHVERDEHIELADMVEEIFTDLEPAAERKNITFEQEGDASIVGSDTLIYRMLFNLTENAIKYNREGGSVKIVIEEGERDVSIRVIDSGIGIPKEYQKSVFQPFFRVDKSRSRQYGGAGLGLSLVWEIVSLHKGNISVEESSDSGTTILVKLPKC